MGLLTLFLLSSLRVLEGWAQSGRTEEGGGRGKVRDRQKDDVLRTQASVEPCSSSVSVCLPLPLAPSLSIPTHIPRTPLLANAYADAAHVRLFPDELVDEDDIFVLVEGAQGDLDELCDLCIDDHGTAGAERSSRRRRW